MKVTFSEPLINKHDWFSYAGRQRVSIDDGQVGSVEFIEVHARTRRGVRRKLARARNITMGERRLNRRQVQKAGDGSVQSQVGGDITMGERFDRGEIPYDPALDWPDRYPDGGQ